jgi:ribosomal protein S18 acetylase RimI-like enzyme
VVFGAKKDFFDDVYGNNQIHLEIIATHPDYQRHGAGSKLTRWGIETASREGRLVTLIASPGAMGFYAHLGFSTVFNLTIQLEGEVEKVEASGMKLGVSSAAL